MENKKMKNLLKNKKGITLIALILTVILMLILAGVAISAIVGEDGFFDKIKSSVDSYKIASNDEATQIENLINMIDGNVNFNEKVDQVTDENPGNLSGEGTLEAPYEIASIEDLVVFSNIVNGGKNYSGEYVKLVRTLDFNSDLSYVNPQTKQFGDINGDKKIDGLKTELTKVGTKGFNRIGNDSKKVFSGTFDGGLNSIMNIFGTGFFGYTDSATIQNLQISVLSMNGETEYVPEKLGENCAGLVYQASNAILIDKCNVKGMITNRGKVGGFISYINKCNDVMIKNSNNYANITAQGDYGTTCAGMVGEYDYSDNEENKITLINCKNYGEIRASSTYIGGLIAQGDTVKKGTEYLYGCYNYGNINSIEQSIADAVANGYGPNTVGGIAGALRIFKWSNYKYRKLL